MAVCYGNVSFVRAMLNDPRVDLNAFRPTKRTPLQGAAAMGNLSILKWWVVSGREMDLGEPGEESDLVCYPGKSGYLANAAEVTAFIQRPRENPKQVRFEAWQELGLSHELSCELFAQTIFVGDGFLKLVPENPDHRAARFFRIALMLPMELQMTLCFRVMGLVGAVMKAKDCETAFRELAAGVVSS